jgi:hypothetical protein
VVAGGVAVAAIVLPRGEKPDHSVSSPPSAAERATLSAKPHPIHLTRADRSGIRDTISFFVSTAVARRHPERAWPIAGPGLREGLTKRQWATGNIPVVPYPAAGVTLLNVQSLERGRALVDVVLRPQSTSGLVSKTFEIELRRSARLHEGWTVAAWVPEGVSESQIALESRNTPASVVAAAYKAPHFSTNLIFIPLGVLLGGLILVPAGLFVREKYLYRRAEADYRASEANRTNPPR